MDRQFQLCGTVRPYFGRSSQPRVGSSSPVVVVAASPGTDRAAGDRARETVAPLQVLRQAARARNWTLFENDESCEVVVPIDTAREQRVSVDLAHQDGLGHPLLVHTSRCGPVAKRNAIALLRRNTHLLQMAFAVETAGEVDLIVLRGSQRIDGATVADVAKMIESIAKYADRVEARLLGTDEF